MFTLTNSLWRIVSGPVMLIFIPTFLTSQTQGFWYTFISLAALTVFADLGFTTIVTQFAAHEYAHLSFNPETRLFEGDEEGIKRIGSLLRFVIRWSLSVGAIGFPIILSVGFIMFYNKDSHVNWPIPWCIYILSSGLSFTTATLLSFFEGCGLIAAIEKNKFIGAVAGSVSTIIFLYLGFGLYALAFTAIITSALNLVLVYYRFGKLTLQVINISKGYIVNWKKDFLQLIWRYAISWSSGYFIFQIYTPLMFQFHGAIEAGRVGISIALVTAVFSISNVWIYVANPKLNMQASLKNWSAMDRLIFKSISLAVLTFGLGGIFILGVMYFYSDRLSFLHRFLGILPMTILLVAWILQIVINGLAVYLRAHKKEPMVLLAIVSAVYIFVSTILITKYLPAQYLFLGFLTSVIWGLAYTVILFIKKRKEWHS
ncbi:hypothetical protein HQ865_17510 [Mucilaginibacter mali]|uniref:O-antigen/teichoic acid export membrane protein n=1 Tax=Mucilaginibacter mali TaxID=2740462 RepID=A0A7D4Q512_9SPHI|nr:hypothetical protein [Mucilaginibacter mali]QKJ31487.1 hypothetical protein HQ865_17510 [Mucilaginibacter mali]